MQAGGDRRDAPGSGGAAAHGRGGVEPPSARFDGYSIAPLLDAIFANSSEAIVVIDEQGDVAFATAGLAMLLGFDAEATVGRSVFEFVHPDDIEQAADLFERRLEFAGSDLGYELRLRHSSGDWRAMVVTAAVLPDPVVGSIALTIRSGEASGDIERALRQRVAIGEYSNRLAAEFMGLSEADDVIASVEESLGDIAFLTGADVVDLVLEHRDRNGVERQARWSQPGLGEIVSSAAVPDPAGYDVLLSRVVLSDDPEGLPDLVMLPDDRVPVSLLSAPLLGHHRRGCLRAMRVVPGSHWNDADVELVRTVAGIFGRALRTARSEQLLSLTYSEGPIGFSVRTWQGALVDCNERYLDLYQLTRGEAEQRTPGDLLRPAHRFEVIDQLSKLHRGEIESATSVMEVERGDGQCFWVRTHTVPLQIPGTSEQLILTSVEDVTETHTQRLELEHAARHDSLTGVANRQALGEFVDRSASANGRLPTLITIDLDRFKTVNDSYGHLVGDVVLRLSAERIVAQVQPSDLVARLGGDEFAIVVPDGDRDEVDRFCEQLLSSFDAPFDVDGLTVFQQMSIGVAPGASSSDPVDLFVNADRALYAAKQRGRHCHVIFDDSLHEQVMQRLTLERELRAAVEHDEFVVYFQPEFSMIDGRIVGAEALLRWNHPERGLTTAAEFITVAEQSGLIDEIGRTSLRDACVHFAELTRRTGDEQLVLRCNISAREFARPELLAIVHDALEVSGLDPTRLCLEMTETTLMDAPDVALTTMTSLNEIGVTSAIDDFGTGYSSLSYLKRFPVKGVKIDRAFVSDIVSDRDSRMIVESITRLAEAMGLETVAEGVEGVEQMEVLRSLGCDLAQGYLVSPAVSADELAGLLAAHRHRPVGAIGAS